MANVAARPPPCEQAKAAGVKIPPRWRIDMILADLTLVSPRPDGSSEQQYSGEWESCGGRTVATSAWWHLGTTRDDRGTANRQERQYASTGW
jgi:hypothetical protein